MIETVLIVGVGIPVVVSTAAVIGLLWTGLSRSDRYCRQLEAMLNEYHRADAARLETRIDTEVES